MPDVYSNFQELQLYELEGQDYLIKRSRDWHPVLIAAPHGGNIEPYTSDIAQWIAGEEFAWYSFEGIKGAEVRKLHITSHHFDEPLLLTGLQQAQIVMTIHGLKNSTEEFLMIGGLDSDLSNNLRIKLQRCGFLVKDSEEKYRGVHPRNICNRGVTGKGVQLELSFALRKRINEDLECRVRFVGAIKSVISAYF
ncbi:phage-related replication protein [Desulfosporosinus orientis DSM 765]|uniref:Phage-related replication protein n=1 Tax=Desulfosporosinus orientis (strain ATCC 19365 / DSM 765 / NCIMB 8382 / VKM B-1628 / Singapore I) TaxID=768706 RepID=G7WIQ9_DESOD|nr:poly-gamma-glutamate hydrolase family protein [Desulfosporosinus orientis]AET69133.1 phage-related replication protein [Desulfosporosinus orientis DSM 765]